MLPEGGAQVPEYLWRLFHVEQMDFEAAATQMVDLCFAPEEVYKTTKFRKQIKNQWARDDPAFVLLLVTFIVLASLAYAISFGALGLGHFVRIVFGQVFIEFLALGVLVASLTRWAANRYMKVQRLLHTDQAVEWLYAFDIHCNGFFPLFVLLYVVQFFLSPFIMRDTFLALLLANALYAFAFGYYWFLTFLGFSSLPFLHNTQKFLWPIALNAVAFMLLTMLRINVCRIVLELYWGGSDARS